MNCQKVVTAAIIQRDGRILLARRGPRERLAGFWEFPGGKVELGETPEQPCLKAREDHDKSIYFI
jgi:8-oxo-dGTP diphosphatase